MINFREKGWGVVDRDQNDQNGGNLLLTVQNGERIFYFFPFFSHLMILINNNRTKADSEKDKISVFNTVYPDGPSHKVLSFDAKHEGC
jgi:hypothetical protein